VARTPGLCPVTLDLDLNAILTERAQPTGQQETAHQSCTEWIFTWWQEERDLMTNTEHFRMLSCYHPCIICRRWMMRMVGHVTSIDRHTPGKHHPSGAGPRPGVRSADNNAHDSCGFLRETTEHTRRLEILPARMLETTGVVQLLDGRRMDGKRGFVDQFDVTRAGGSTWSSPDHDVIGLDKYSGCQGAALSNTLTTPAYDSASLPGQCFTTLRPFSSFVSQINSNGCWCCSPGCVV
jgi:hypothetical protein